MRSVHAPCAHSLAHHCAALGVRCAFLCAQDIVLLQEVWVQADVAVLQAAGAAGGLAYHEHHRAGVFGAGLLTLSRWPITTRGFWRYAAAGFASAVSCGDFYAAKGVGWTRIGAPWGELDVFNTHLHACYSHEPRLPPPDIARAVAQAAAAQQSSSPHQRNGGHNDDDNSSSGGGGAVSSAVDAWPGPDLPDDDDAGVRLSQVLELSEAVRLICLGAEGAEHTLLQGSAGTAAAAAATAAAAVAQRPIRPVILAGDLNCRPGSLEVELLRLRLPWLADSWQEAQAAGRAHGGSSANPQGHTCHTPGNTFRPRRQVPQRIDYVWSSLAATGCEVALTVDPRGVSYSDHCAVRSCLLVPPKCDSKCDASGPGAAAGAGAAASGPMRLGGGAGAGGRGSGPPGGGGGVQTAADQTYNAQQLATLLAAERLLTEGQTAFAANGLVCRLGGGFLLASVLYVAIVLPLLLPQLALSGVVLSCALLGAGVAGAAGAAALLAGAIADAGQLTALSVAANKLRRWAARSASEACAQPPRPRP